LHYASCSLVMTVEQAIDISLHFHGGVALAQLHTASNL